MGLRAMFSGISGLQAHSTWLDVIGNNVANVNTVAYKASRVEFADAISQTQSGGSGSSTASNLGGINPQQIGLGTRVASIFTIFTQGPMLQTGNATDVAINGTGFLVVKSGSQQFFTRAGNLTFDNAGNLVDQNGGLVQGFTSTIKYTQRTLDSRIATPPSTQVTDASLFLDNTNVGNIGNIQIKTGFVEPAHATQTLSLIGNLDSFQQANQTGGILQLNPGGVAPQLPIAMAGPVFNGLKANLAAYGGGFAIFQASNLAQPVDAVNPVPNQTTPVLTGTTLTLAAAQANATNAWQQSPPIAPALTQVSTVYDSLGNPRQVTTLFYQVNDLGTAVPPVNTPPLNQTMYAWYSFDTTGGLAVSNTTLVGGTGINEGDSALAGGYDRGIAGNTYFGDFIYFNTDGSLASMGGVQAGAAGTFQDKAHIYLPPNQPAAGPVSPIPAIGAEIVDLTMNFGTSGILGFGRRDGLIGDAEGSYQVINGVNTYVPNSHATYTQDGYTDGALQGVQFDQTGRIIGTFTNGQNTVLGQVVLAQVDNPDGMNKVGNDYFTAGVNSGRTFIGLAGLNGLGTVQGDTLEGSNVDLTVELSNMIIAQRGFEVNARTISVTNSTLQTLTQLGQGG